MTEEYKNILFDYITGNITTTSSSTDEIFIDKDVSNIDLLSQLPAGTTTYYIHGIVGNNDQTSNNYALYGGYGVSDNTENGFIAILDTDFNIVQVITAFPSGTNLRPVYALEVNTEDNTFFGVDFNTTTNRFIMLNNFLIPDENNNYVVKLRTSYNFSDNAFYPAFCKLFKNPNSAHYIIVGQNAENPAPIKVIDLKVNVGQANEWNSYSSTYDYNNNAYVDFNSNDNAFIRLLVADGTAVRQLTKNYTATTFSASSINTTSSTFFGSNNVYFASSSNYYYSLYNTTTKESSIYQYNGSNTLINSGTLGDMTNYQLKGYNGELYIYYNVNDGVVVKGQAYYFRYKGSWSPIKLKGFTTWSVQSDIFIGNRYNLNKIFIYGRILNRTESCLLVEDYNPSNYNSTPYIDGTAIYPQKCRLYSSGELVFARNDYNISSLGNTFTTTVEVPNVYLNSGSIQPNQLISKTNQIIVSDTTPINKNIYEKVYINFINSINSYDEDTGNNFDTTTLVKNISGLGDTYTNSYIGYWNTTLNGVQVDSGTIDSYTYLGRLTGQFDLSFTPSGVADRLNFLDDNGNIYAWIDVSNCSVGTTYDISQKVRLADIPLGSQHVVWNDNNVQFNGNSVVYYTSI